MKFSSKLGILVQIQPIAWVTAGMLALGAAGFLIHGGGQASAAPAAAMASASTEPAVAATVAKFHQTVEPILKQRCYACHAGDDNHTGIAFDTLTTDAAIAKNPELWLKVLRNTRSHVMPPPGNDAPTPQQQSVLENWIEFSAFGVDPNHLDPGKQTLRRLNRREYHNTIADLTGVDFDTDLNFPPDDIGYGFDNVGDILNVSPMLMEKYMQAAQMIVAQAVPRQARIMPVVVVQGNKFSDTATPSPNSRGPGGGSLDMSFFTETEVTHTFNIKTEGDYQIIVNRNVHSAGLEFNPAKINVTYTADGTELAKNEFVWKDDDTGTDQVNVHWDAGPHHFSIGVHPTAFVDNKAAVVTFRVLKVQLQGPQDESKWNPMPGYAKFFPRGEASSDPAERKQYAREILSGFAFKAFRRPVPDETIDKLVDIAQSIYDAPGGTFEKGISQAMVAILASPRFIYRVESPQPAIPGGPFAAVDEYGLASRLSYFLWSTMPDDELFKLAAAGQLRANLAAQVKRMLADPKSQELVQNFTGQWLQSREVLNVSINPREVLLREGVTTTPANQQFPGQIRTLLKQEPEALFGYIMQNDRSVNEFIDSDYVFVNQALATFYNMDGVTGQDMHKVQLLPGDLRGGVLTMGSTMMITSNPTRTSPVKRGKWVLENILGAPTPPPPPDIPPLEQTATQIAGQKPTLRQILAVHRQNPTCASCHDRMDPIGLSEENFNAEGLYRTEELDQPIDPSGELFTGEKFKDVSDLKKSLIQNHLPEFYHCLTEKLMTYACGRGMEYYDMPTIDAICDRMNRENGHFSALLMGVIESAPFQEQRVVGSGGGAKQ
jgi:hypothetical protein